MKLRALEILAIDEALRFKFLELHRLKLMNIYADGQKSAPYFNEASLRRHLDAVAVLLFEKKGESVFVHLRETLRPALLFRDLAKDKNPAGKSISAAHCVLLEVVAGLIEEHDLGDEGQRRRALAEAWEEAGYKITERALFSLGAAILPTPGMNPERIHLFAASVEGLQREPPPGDGSAIEEVGEIVTLALEEALAAAVEGRIVDGKTQICLHRLEQLRRERKI